ncbi:MAG: hypothetical protein JXA89_10490 [Anaerolineae bacterium]|nr:hypothetical protein [Anaerolineae bacterium]
MVQCIHHPQYQAIEHCEHCHVPLCGKCLWYVESGERLCERCAKAWQEVGHVVYPPEQFAEGIQPTLKQPVADAQPRHPYEGNSVDLAGFAAACLGGMMLLYCIPCLNALAPLLGLLVGIIALVEAKRAANPARTRILAGIGVAGGGLVLLAGLAWIGLTLFMPFMLMFVEQLNQTP